MTFEERIIEACTKQEILEMVELDNQVDELYNDNKITEARKVEAKLKKKIQEKIKSRVFTVDFRTAAGKETYAKAYHALVTDHKTGYRSI